jgi:hypothetical protein
MSEQTAAVILILGVAMIGLLIYFLPAVVAGLRGHQNTAAIFVLTLLLGWSFLGWAVALVWAFTAVQSNAASDSRTASRPAAPLAVGGCLLCVLLVGIGLVGAALLGPLLFVRQGGLSAGAAQGASSTAANQTAILRQRKCPACGKS